MGAVPSSHPQQTYVTPSLTKPEPPRPADPGKVWVERRSKNGERHWEQVYQSEPRMVHRADIGCTGEDFGFE